MDRNIQKPARILLIRHGQSEGNIDESKYIELGDMNVPLTEIGEKQAFQMGQKCLAQLYNAQARPLLYASGYTRPEQTLECALLGMDNQGILIPEDERVYGDVRLIEQSFGTLNDIAHINFKDPTEQRIANMFLKMSRDISQRDVMTARTLHGESYADKILQTKSFIDGSLQRDIDEGHDDIWIFAHGRTITAFIANWFHVPLKQIKPVIKNPGNCDVIEITGTPKNWTCTRLYKGETGETCREDILGNVTYTTRATLAQPRFLKS